MTDDIEQVLSSALGTGVKFYLGMEVEMSKILTDEVANTAFHTKNTTLLQSTDLKKELRTHSTNLIERIETFVRDGSGWISHRIPRIILCLAKLVP